jgi:hypothetical protein
VIAKGLGKNSPIQIRLNRQNYHALISRHGQPVRWMKARPCTCLMTNNRPDPNCSVCGGDGWQYDYPRSVIETDYARVTAENVITLPEEYVPVAIHAVWDTFGVEYAVDSFSGREITISGARIPEHYEILEVSSQTRSRLRMTSRESIKVPVYWMSLVCTHRRLTVRIPGLSPRLYPELPRHRLLMRDNVRSWRP